jgi:hypothetical protein
LLSFASASAEDPSFSGTWARNARESDDAEAKIEEAARAMTERSRGRAPVLPNEPDVDPSLQRGLGSLVLAAERLVIEERAAELHVDDGEGPTRIFYLDGRKHLRQTPSGAKLETVCSKQGRQIRVEQKTEQGTRISETYELAADGREMKLTVRVEGKRFKEPLIVRTVYDRSAGPRPPFD